MSDYVTNAHTIALVGFGEAANAVLAGWGLGGSGRVSAYDIKTDDAETAPRMRSHYTVAGVRGADTLQDALAGASLVFCLVTADRALAAAEAAAAVIEPGTLWLDGNSCAPQTKRAAAEAIDGAGGRYVDVAIMAPIFPMRHQTPMLLAGPFAEDAAAAMTAMDMRVDIAGETVGDASTIKMIRSVMIKGIEALTAECMLAAHRAGVADAVLQSLAGSDPGRNWPAKSAYNLERMMVHGARRAAEMREVAATLDGLGLPSRMAQATAEWHDQVARLGLPGGEADLDSRARRILDAL
ncbi:NAD(P)-dependent oxidoreductase [Acuticoccus sediminis]|uniref:NAD(P)-dependent oxidoreductase n=1 Tax=Acuticoccus sediminis TaxID=2184697 RepID=UPI001CFDA7BB|nr:NAD(P)-dependent oxidoreductase [Acuticoccus sediminis]